MSSMNGDKGLNVGNKCICCMKKRCCGVVGYVLLGVLCIGRVYLLMLLAGVV